VQYMMHTCTRAAPEPVTTGEHLAQMATETGCWVMAFFKASPSFLGTCQAERQGHQSQHRGQAEA
jgi:hypothetical protein